MSLSKTLKKEINKQNTEMPILDYLEWDLYIMNIQMKKMHTIFISVDCAY